MNQDKIITQIRTVCTSFAGRVGGAADFSKGLETTSNMILPAAYVIPMEDVAGENELLNGLMQHVTERFGVVLEIDNSSDRRGQAASDQIEAFKYEIHTAILNWRIDDERAARGLQYSGGRLLDFDRARLFWILEYELDVTIDDDDGFQVPQPPLTEIDITDTVHDLTAKVVLDQ